jgi:methylmalonic aciduria homocystinuria type C protein
MRDALAEAGFDIVVPFDGGLVDAERRAGLLVGNTRALWPVFVAAKQPGPDPLDRYVEAAIDPLVPERGRVIYAHRQYDGAFVAFQPLAVAAGLGSLSETNLVIHPTYGPWFALRAAIVVAGDAPSIARQPPSCRCGAPCREALARARGTTDWRAWLAVRDACHVGREYRYSEEQLAYHYIQGLLRTPGG